MTWGSVLFQTPCFPSHTQVHTDLYISSAQEHPSFLPSASKASGIVAHRVHFTYEEEEGRNKNRHMTGGNFVLPCSCPSSLTLKGKVKRPQGWRNPTQRHSPLLRASCSPLPPQLSFLPGLFTCYLCSQPSPRPVGDPFQDRNMASRFCFIGCCRFSFW